MLTSVTLDYELYFGKKAGTVEHCLIEPTNALLDVARRRASRLVFFVDAGFILRLEEQSRTVQQVARQFDAVRRQLTRVVSEGHDIQLHIHPHWEDSHWNGSHWQMDTRRYRLHTFSPGDIARIVIQYRDALIRACGSNDVCAYRAGGLAMQPFDKLAAALGAAGIVMDSSVVPGMHISDPVSGCDFRSAPTMGVWRFSADPNIPDPRGGFLEIPISSTQAPVLTKLSSAVSKRFGPSRHAPFGDGYAVWANSPGHSWARLRRIFDHERIAVTLDGYRASLLERAYHDHANQGHETFTVMGHPKALTPFSLDCLDGFLDRCAPRTVTFPQLRKHFQAS